MGKPNTAFAALTVLAVSGCTTDQIVGRYSTAVCETEMLEPKPGEGAFAAGTVPDPSPPQSCAAVVPRAIASAVSIPTPPKSSPTAGTALPDNFGAAYVGALAKFSKSAKDLRADLAAPLAGQESPTGALDRSVFRRTLVVTVGRTGGFSPTDRLEATEVVVRPHGARFDSWDTLITPYTTIEAGSVTLTQARGATQGLTVGAPSGAPVTGSFSLGASQSSTRAEEFAARNRVETVTALLDDDGRALRIRRQGGYGIDLTGNTVIQVEMTFTGDPSPSQPEQSNRVASYFFSAPAYKDAKGRWLPTQQIRIMGRPVTAVPPGTAIRADVYLTYTIRHVVSGGDTYEEKDDHVVEKTVGPVRNRVVLIPAREASPAGFGLHIRGAGKNRGFAFQIVRPGWNRAPLCFATAAEATEFLVYLRARPTGRPDSVGDAQLVVVRPERTPPLVPLLQSDLYQIPLIRTHVPNRAIRWT